MVIFNLDVVHPVEYLPILFKHIHTASILTAVDLFQSFIILSENEFLYLFFTGLFSKSTSCLLDAFLKLCFTVVVVVVVVVLM